MERGTRANGSNRAGDELSSPLIDSDYGTGAHDDAQLYCFSPDGFIKRWRVRQTPVQGSPVVGHLVGKTFFSVLKRSEQWLLISCPDVYGWVNEGSSRNLLHRVAGQTFRRHEAWKGKNRFLLGGRIMLGSSPQVFAVTNLALLVASATFFFRVCPVLKDPAPLVALAAPLWLAATALLWVTATMDPGIIPRRPLAEPNKFSAPDFPGQKFCETCNLFRPRRAKHCR
jgi:hypothetical protein